MVLSYVNEQIINITADIYARSLNTSDDLKRLLIESEDLGSQLYLGHNFKPSVYLDGRKPAGHCMTDLFMVSELEPECQQSKSILQRIFIFKGNGPEESLKRLISCISLAIGDMKTFYGLHSMCCQAFPPNINRFVLAVTFHVTNNIEIG
jgi:hypothetical protein